MSQCRRRSLHRSPVGNDALVAGWRGPRTAEPEFGHGGAVSHSAHSEERTSLETPTIPVCEHGLIRSWGTGGRFG
jgi:hypothetical protein